MAINFKPGKEEYKEYLLDKLQEADGVMILITVTNGKIQLWFQGEEGVPVTQNVQEKMLDLTESIGKWLNGKDGSKKEKLIDDNDRSMLTLLHKYKWEE